MILVLSCFDLAVVSITHPVIMLSTISLSNENFSKLREEIRTHADTRFSGIIFRGCALDLNIERFLGKTFPIFHRASVPIRKVPKKRLLLLPGFLTILVIHPMAALSHINRAKTPGHIIVMVDLSIFLFLIRHLLQLQLNVYHRQVKYQG
jgi:hypothetical protein